MYPLVAFIPVPAQILHLSRNQTLPILPFERDLAAFIRGRRRSVKRYFVIVRIAIYGEFASLFPIVIAKKIT